MSEEEAALLRRLRDEDLSKEELTIGPVRRIFAENAGLNDILFQTTLTDGLWGAIGNEKLDGGSRRLKDLRAMVVRSQNDAERTAVYDEENRAATGRPRKVCGNGPGR